MKNLTKVILVTLALCSQSFGHELYGTWVVSDFSTADIHALTIREAKEKYGTDITISKDLIKFGPDSLENPKIKQTNKKRDRLEFGIGEIYVDTTLRHYEIRTNQKKRWMAPLGEVHSVGEDAIVFHWDGVIFTAKKIIHNEAVEKPSSGPIN